MNPAGEPVRHHLLPRALPYVTELRAEGHAEISWPPLLFSTMFLSSPHCLPSWHIRLKLPDCRTYLVLAALGDFPGWLMGESKTKGFLFPHSTSPPGPIKQECLPVFQSHGTSGSESDLPAEPSSLTSKQAWVCLKMAPRNTPLGTH